MQYIKCKKCTAILGNYQVQRNKQDSKGSILYI